MTRFLLFACLLFCANGLFAQSNRDIFFSQDGLVVFDSLLGVQEGNGLAIQSDGKILAGKACVNSSPSSGIDFLLLRYNSNGSPDNSFGVNGVVKTDYNQKDQWVTSLLLQPDGKIIACGAVNDSFFYAHFQNIRYNIDGSIDSTFGINGGVTTNFLGGFCIATTSTMLPNGKFIVGGYIWKYENPTITNYIVVAQYNADGSLDTLFGNSGAYITPVTFNIQSGSEPVKIIAIAGGKILVVANCDTGLEWKLTMIRLNADGSLDNTYYNNGFFMSNFGITMNGVQPHAATVLNSGKIFLACSTSDTTLSNIFLARCNTDGTIDNSFGDNGYLRASYLPYLQQVSCVAELNDGKIAIGGGYDKYISLVLFDSTGSLLGGTKDELLNTYNPFIYDMEVQADGKLVMAGTMSNHDYYYPSHPELIDRKHYLLRYVQDLVLGLLNFEAKTTPPLLYPNPLKEVEHLKYTLAENEQISIVLLDGQGKLVTTFVENEKQPKGDHEVELNLPTGLPNGTYFIQIVSPKGKISIKTIK